MSRAPSTFRQRDVTAAVKAVVAAGVEVVRIIIDRTGNIVICTAKAQDEAANDKNEWDEASS